ncbi:MAG: EAL domain-containing protein [Nitrospinota bacterium]|nr:EAL domain-containing protein [Nitrospinota bacterium]
MGIFSSIGQIFKVFRSGLLTFLATLLITISLAVYTQLQVKKSVEDTVANRLTSLLASAETGYQIWAEDQKSRAYLWANTAEIASEIEELVRIASLPDIAKEKLLNSIVTHDLRHRLAPIVKKLDYFGFVVTDRNKRNIAARLDEPVLVQFDDLDDSFFNRAMAGEVVISHPKISSIALPDENGVFQKGVPTMFASSPVFNARNEVIAILSFRIRPVADFSKIFHAVRVGDSGETYAFDRNGLMLTESRFAESLREFGIIKKRSMLEVELRDPGVNLMEGERPSIPREEWPFTVMARSALGGGSGVNVAGYPDYRGVDVVGAWKWLEKYDIGIASELDKEEAFATLNVLEELIFALSVLVVVLSVAIIAIRRYARETALKDAAFRGVISSTNEGYWEIDSGRKTTVVNKALCEILGYEAEELVGRSPLDFMHESSKTEFLKKIATVSQTDHRLYEELIFIRKNGEMVYLRLSATTKRDSAGNAIGSFAFVTDFTDIKKAEDALKRSEDALLKGQKVAKMGSWDWNIITNELVWSDEIYRIFGLEPQEFGATYDAFLGSIHPDDRELVVQAVNDAVAGKKDYKVEHRVVRPNGVIRIVEEIGEVTFDLSWKPQRMIGIVHDITERKKAEEDLRRSEESLNKAQEISNTGNWGWNLFTNEMEWSDELYRIFGYEPRSVKPSYDLFINAVHSHDRDMVALKLKEAVKDRTGYKIEHRVEWLDGMERIVHMQGELVLDRRGNPVRMIGIAHDITERVKATAELTLAYNVFENVEEAIMVTDVLGVLTYVNPAFLNITGFTPEQALGCTPAMLRSQKHDKAFYEAMWKELLETGRWQGEIWNRRKDGEVYPAWLSISSISNEAGQRTQYIGVLKDITDIKRSQEEIKYQAYHDPLTGLPNRILFKDRLKQSLIHAGREKRQIAVMFLDVDNFKNINDSLGHPVGDRLLQGVGARIVGTLREMDTVSRVGGDEFTVILEDIRSPQDAIQAARKIVEAISHPFVEKGNNLFVTTSIGITVFPTDSEDLNTLLQNADLAMYRAKKLGKNNYQLFTTEMNTNALERLEIENDLRLAIDRQEFSLVYQPKVSLGSGEIMGVEVLVRWGHPTKGMVLPSKFIPVAEESGLILNIGKWVLFEACRQTKAWLDAGLPSIIVSVNISAVQFKRGDLVELVEEALGKTGLPAENLDLEITESLIMTDVNSAIETMKRLNDMGVELSIDDFGTGYSSLVYLKKFPIDTLKIDQAFVRNLTTDANDAAITDAVISMGHSLNLKVVAEGVETAAHLEYLHRQGCDIIQGYYFSKPVDASTFEEYLRSGKNLEMASIGRGK